MGSRDKRIDAFIARSADFAVPILEHLREIVHEACPDAEETLKWSMPTFMYKGSILCGMAAFKKHCAFNFWLGSKMKDPDGILEQVSRTSMGHLGRIESPDDLPPRKVLLKYVKEAMKLTDAGAKMSRSAPVKKEKKELVVPSWFMTALKRNKEALATFRAFSYSKQNDYVEWLTEARSESTREKRMETAIEWLAEGKSRNWKYERK